MSNNILKLKKIEKSFPGVRALKGVNFDLNKGEVHALMGENGAGKSTLMKVLSGIYSSDSGEIILEGEKVSPKSAIEAQEIGISTVFQELSLIPHATVCENIMIGREIKKGIFIDKRENTKKVKYILHEIMGIEVDLETELQSLSSAVQQMISIARAISIDCKILVLDEPTSSLDKEEVKTLFRVIRRLKKEGIGIVYISHKMEEIFEISDRITVLRDGSYVSTYETKSVNNFKLICDMIGKDASEIINYKKEYDDKANNEVVCRLNGVASKTKTTNLENISINLKKGELLGLSGLLGSGRTEVTNVIFGIDHCKDGSIEIYGEQIHKNSPKKSIKNGLGLVPEERRKSGIIPNMSVKENLTLPFLNEISKFGFIDKKREEKIVDEYIKKLGVKLASSNQSIKDLSGGNQQKVILARWMAKNTNLMILDEPTRGIDVGAKREIEKLMATMIDEGKSILMISSEIEEMTRNCDRTYVMVDGKIVKELAGEEISERNIIDSIANAHQHSEVL